MSAVERGSDRHAATRPEAASGLPNLPTRWQPSRLLLLAAADHATLLGELRRRREEIESCGDNRPPAPPLAEHRVAIVARDAADLAARIAVAESKLAAPKARRMSFKSTLYHAAGPPEPAAGGGRTVFLFPGQGSQHQGMLGELCLLFPQIRAWFEELDRSVEGLPIPAPSLLAFPPAEGLATDDREWLQRELYGLRGGAQLGLIVNLALHDLVTDLGVGCDMMIGHSNGEHAALFASGAFRPGRNRLFEAIRRMIEAAIALPPPDAPEAVLTAGLRDRTVLDQLLAEAPDDLFLSMNNCPSQCVLAGRAPAVEHAARRLAETGGIVLRVPLDRAYHTPLFASWGRWLRELYDEGEVGPGRVPLYSCMTGAPYPTEPGLLRQVAAEQWSHPIDFERTVRRAYDDGARLFVEIGPDSKLRGFVGDILRGRDHLAVSTSSLLHPPLQQLHRMAGELFVHGVPLDFTSATWRTLAWPEQSQDPAPPATRAGGGERLAVVLAHHDLMSDFLASQARVLSLVLASPPAAAAGSPAPARPVPALPASPAFPTFPALPASPAFPAFPALPASPAFPTSPALPASPALAASPNSSAPPALPVTAPEPALPAAVGVWPLLPDDLHCDGRRLEAERRFDLDRDPLLRDHSLGPTPAGSLPAPPSLAVLPFTFSLEIAAEAAQRLCGGGALIGMTAVKASRWLALDRGALTVAIVAELAADSAPAPAAGPRFVEVSLHQVEAGRRLPAFEARVEIGPSAVLSAAPSTSTAASSLSSSFSSFSWSVSATSPGSPAWRAAAGLAPPRFGSAADFYLDYAFHGPAFHGIRHVRGLAGETIAADLVARPRPLPLGAGAPSPFLLDPALLDCAGQLVGFWLLDGGRRDFGIFPISLRRLGVHGPAPAAGDALTGRAEVRWHSYGATDATVEIADAAGRPLYRLEGFVQRYLALPPSFAQAMLGSRPRPRFLSAEVEAANGGNGPAGAVASRVIDGVPHGFLSASWGVWSRALAHQVLTRQEIDDWYERQACSVPWLLARTVGKETVRAWAAQEHGLEIAATDLELSGGEAGTLTLHCPALAALDTIVAPAAIGTLAASGAPDATVATGATGAIDARGGLPTVHVEPTGERVQAWLIAGATAPGA